MKIQWLELIDFRCFRSQRIELHPEVTVFFGENGAGKTAVVDALSILLTPIPGVSDEPSLNDDDMRLESSEVGGQIANVRALSARIESSVDFEASELKWSLTKERGKKPKLTGQSIGRRIERYSNAQKALPVVAVYSSDRTFRDTPPSDTISDRFTGYVDARDAGQSLDGLRAWWRKQHDIRRVEPVPVLDTVEQAVALAVHSLAQQHGDDDTGGELHLPVWEPREEDILIHVPQQGRLALRQMSDGYRCIIAMIADIARRAALLHPRPGSDLLKTTSGVVIIDEIDLHLHPVWQRKVLPILKKTFPRIQFVVTTHSAEVLATARNEQVRKLDVGTLSNEPLFVEGRDSNSINVEVMRAGERDPRSAKLLRDLLESISRGDISDAESKLADLRAKWGPHDADLAEAEAQLAWERE